MRGGARVIIQVREFEGRYFIDFREWIEECGNLKPTRKGCTIPPELAFELGEALLASAAQTSA